MLRIGSCAAGSLEPRQVGNEAAVRGYAWVPQVNLVRVRGGSKPPETDRQRVHDLPVRGV